MDNELYHHGIIGQKWGIRRYQNEDGTLTKAGIRHLKALEKKDTKWAKKNYSKIYKKAFDRSKNDVTEYAKNELIGKYNVKSKSFINEYNKKLSEIMTKNITDIQSPSGKAIKFIAKRGEVGVHMALADQSYDMSNFKNGIWNNGRIAYKKKTVNVE